MTNTLQHAAQKLEHWHTLAQSYFALGAPLHPSAEDIAAVARFVAQVNAAGGGHGVQMLMWGATPALAEMQWPAGSTMLAVDRSNGMLNLVWPGDIPQQRQALCADWLDLRVAEHAYDVVIGDGSFNCLAYPNQYQQLAAVTHRALQPGGALISRFFVKPAQPETLDAVFCALMSGEIHSFHAFKWRLVMAMLGDQAINIAVRDVWEMWDQAQINLDKLMRVTGWPATTINTINNYQHSEARYSFPSLPEIQQCLAEWFEVSQVYTPTYELGERCPTVMFRPKQSPMIPIEK